MKSLQKKICFYAESENEDFVNLLFSALIENKIKEVFKMKITKNGSINCLKIECKNEDFLIVKEIFKEIFINVFLNEYKFNFLNDKISLQFLEKGERLPLVKALTAFDIAIDRQLIYEALKDLKDCLSFESFIKFKLSTVIKRWNELCELANENSTFFAAGETFMELLRFLISNLGCEMGNVYIYKKNNDFICSGENNEKIFSFGGMEDLLVISNLISLSPSRIIIKTKTGDLENSAINLICKLFAERLEILEK